MRKHAFDTLVICESTGVNSKGRNRLRLSRTYNQSDFPAPLQLPLPTPYINIMFHLLFTALSKMAEKILTTLCRPDQLQDAASFLSKASEESAAKRRKMDNDKRGGAAIFSKGNNKNTNTTSTLEILKKLEGFYLKEVLGSSTLLLKHDKQNVEALLSFDKIHSEDIAAIFQKSSTPDEEDENTGTSSSTTTTSASSWQQVLTSLLNRVNNGIGDELQEEDEINSKKSTEEEKAPVLQNDRYTSGVRIRNAADLQLSLVLPADRRDVYKATPEKIVRLLETPELYTNVTKKKFVENPKTVTRDAWVRNILRKEAEQDRVLFETEKYLVVKDSKWVDEADEKVGEEDTTCTTSSTSKTTAKEAQNLHCLLLLKDETIRSLRDLKGEKHLPVLTKVFEEIIPSLSKTYSIPETNFLSFVHYHPTFWYFHVHIMTAENPMFASNKDHTNLVLSIFDRFHKLEIITALLEADSEHYAKCNLPLVLKPEIAAWYSNKEKDAGRNNKDTEDQGGKRDGEKKRRKKE
ncbi:unnamed protein product [Amoebophrya sp. A25]|nr:unnamed protein product [Amoebophrya sp. A25]|eukprot:GSA25T00022988001.1